MKTTKKRVIVLPREFQEVLILHEMKLEKEAISVDTIRKLNYLYSLGMEYYDSINNIEIYQFYLDKFNKLLINPKVSELLENNSFNLKGCNEFQLFKEDPYQVVKSPERRNETIYYKTKFVDDKLPNHSESFYIQLTKQGSKETINTDNRYSSCLTNNTCGEDKKEYKNKIKNEFANLDLKLNKINENMKRDISEQVSHFEKTKKKRLYDQNSRMKNEKLSTKSNEDQTNYSSDHSDENYREVKNIAQKSSLVETLFIKEVEEFVDKNTREMNVALDELKLSFEDEINGVDEEIFPEVVKGLKDDMKNELDNLKEQYEEQKRCEIEKIRAKYFNNKN